MTDLLMLAILVAFFALAVVFVRACDLIIGPDVEAARVESDPVASNEESAAA
jgi:hypothetical protein